MKHVRQTKIQPIDYILKIKDFLNRVWPSYKNGDIKARWSAPSMHCTVSNINITKIQIFT